LKKFLLTEFTNQSTKANPMECNTLQQIKEGECSKLTRTLSLLEAAELSAHLENSGGLPLEHRRFTFTLPATQNIVSLVIE
jgi:hypothetical protein